MMTARKRLGEPVLPLAFGEAGLPAHPSLRLALAGAAGQTGYGPVAGQAALREAAAGYWTRRGLRTDPAAVVCGPGSKSLLFGLMLAIGGDVAVPRLSWVTYAAQASLLGARPYFVDIRPGEGGVPDPAQLGSAVRQARADGRQIRSVILTLPDNPTGTLARPGTIRELCQVAEEHDLIIVSDEIYRDLVHDTAAPFTSPACYAPGRTIVTTALSKSLALGGWRIGAARLPGGADAEAGEHLGRRLRSGLIGAGRADPAGGRLRLQRPARTGRADRAQPPAAPGGRPGGCRPLRGRGRHRAAPAGRLLPLPRLRPGAGPAARPARRRHERRPRRPAAPAERRGRAGRQRVWRRPGRPAGTGRHGPSVWRNEPAAGVCPHLGHAAGTAVDRGRAGPDRGSPGRPHRGERQRCGGVIPGGAKRLISIGKRTYAGPEASGPAYVHPWGGRPASASSGSNSGRLGGTSSPDERPVNRRRIQGTAYSTAHRVSCWRAFIQARLRLDARPAPWARVRSRVTAELAADASAAATAAAPATRRGIWPGRGMSGSGSCQSAATGTPSVSQANSATR